MSEQLGDDVPPNLPRRSVEVALAKIEAKLDVALAQDRARLDEHERRIAGLDASLAADRAAAQVDRERIAALEAKAQAAKEADAAVAATKPPPVGVTSWVALFVAILTALYLVLDHFEPNL